MNVLISCERSGTVREAFRALGAHAWSCDLQPADDNSRHHLQADALSVAYGDKWDLMICHPPCTYLCGSGLHWIKRRPGRELLMERAVQFALDLWNAPIPMICLENPVGVLSRRLRKPDQIIQPYEFGEDASKATCLCLWLCGLPLLRPNPSQRVAPRIVDGKPRWANQTDSGQNRLGPSPTRSDERSKTYSGIAAAMAEQWGSTAALRALK